MTKYLVIIASNQQKESPEPYVVTTFPNQGQGCRITPKRFVREVLKQTSIDCLNATEAGFENTMQQVAEKGYIAIEAALTDECAARLGWSE